MGFNVFSIFFRSTSVSMRKAIMHENIVFIIGWIIGRL